MTQTHRAWLVDLDGTLYRPFPVKLAMGATLLAAGRDAMPAISAFRRAHERLRHEDPGLAGSPYERQLALAAQDCGWEIDAVAKVVGEWMIERPGPWLKRARRKALIGQIAAHVDRGGLSAVVSDYPASRKLAAMELDPLFAVVVSNGEPGGPAKLKPDPEGYLLAANALGVEPGECLVIGDRPDADGEAARRAGMAFRRVG